MSDPAGADPAAGEPPTPGEPGERFPQRAALERELVLGAFLVVLAASTLGLVDPDLPGHTIYGLQHLVSGRLATVDPYSYAIEGLPWTNHEWLFELGIAWVFRAGGDRALVLLQALVWSSTAGLILWHLWRRTRDFVPTILLFLLVVTLTLYAISVRPQMFTFLGFTSLVLLLEQGRRGKRWGWLGAGLLFLPWVNLHGGFLAGLGVFGLYGLGLVLDTALRRPGLTGPDAPPPAWSNVGWGLAGGVLGAGLTLANPSGTELYAFLLESLGRPRPMISEWAPLELNLQGVLYLGLIPALLLALGRARRRVPLSHVLVLAVTAYMGIKHVRHQGFFVIAAVVFAGGELAAGYRALVPGPQEDLSPGRRRGLQWAARLLIPCFWVLSVVGSTKDFLRLRVRPEGLCTSPTGAFEFVEAHDVRGNLFVNFDWAQLVIGRYHDRFKVFFDGRFRTVYPERVERDYQALQYSLAGRERALEDYPTELILLETGIEALDLLRADPRWVEIYRDSVSALFARSDLRWAQQGLVVGADPLPVLRFELAPVSAD